MKLSQQPSVNLHSRLESLRKVLVEKKLDAFLVSSIHNRYYLTGWQGDSESGHLLITARSAFIFTDNRYTEEVIQKIPHFKLVEYKSNFSEFLGQVFSERKLQRVGFESQEISVAFFKSLKKYAKSAKLIPCENTVEDLRVFKDEDEIKLLKKSISIADKAFNHVRNIIKVGMTEKEIAWEMEQFMRQNGSEKNAWEPFIVATGANSSMIHYGAGEAKIKKGDQVQLDWGCVYQGYHCDISRVLFMGPPSAKQAEVYNLVLEAQKRAIEKIVVEKPTQQIDIVAREFLENKTDFAFGHSIGHGVGLEVHELPRVNLKAKTKITPGQVITVEPGIYEPGWGGVRIEDMVLVTENGPQVLTKSPKDMEEVII